MPVILFNTLSELQIFTRFFVGGFCFGFLLFLNMWSSILQSNLLNSDLKITSSPSFPLCFKLVRVMCMVLRESIKVLIVDAFISLFIGGPCISDFLS